MSRKDKKKNSVGWPVFSVIITLILVILLAYIMIVRIQGGIPTIGGFTILQIKSGSMETTIPEGMYILVRKTSINKVQEGDVVSFFSTDPSIAGALNTHRVVGIETDENGETYLVTRGDANYKNDDYPVYGNQLFSKYLTNLKGLTVIANFIMTKAVLLLMFLGYAVVAAVTVVGVIQAVKKTDDDSSKGDSKDPTTDVQENPTSDTDKSSDDSENNK